jgi:hypothetical protein
LLLPAVLVLGVAIACIVAGISFVVFIKVADLFIKITDFLTGKGQVRQDESSRTAP